LPGGSVSGNLVPFREIADPAPALGIAGREIADPRFAGGGASEIEKDFDGGGLAGAVRTEEAEHLAGGDREVDAVQRGDPRAAETAAIDLPEAGDLDYRRRHILRSYVGTTRKVEEVFPVSRNALQCLIGPFSSIRRAAAGRGSSASARSSASLPP